MSSPIGDHRKLLAPLQERFRRLPIWKRVLLALLITPPLLAGGTAGAYYIRLHQNADSASISELPLFPSPQKNRRYLILAPHCDDETLGVGGFIADATAKGASVTVVYLTNGDGFPAAATRELKEVHVSPSDYVRFAERRQAEATTALYALGVPVKQVYFLGYPDRGLRPMWEANWNTANPYRSYYTGHTHSPYPVTYTPHTPYCGTALQNDLQRVMEQVKPTDLFVTHPADDHPDHSAAASFVQSALRTCAVDKRDDWAQTAQLHYYIVHRGDWPLPQGKHPAEPLTPPPGLAATDTKWRAYLLSTETERRKDQALGRYVSQLNICRRFLTSFIRDNELFGDMNAPTITPSTNDWTTVALDGRRDDVVRFVDPAADLTSLAVRRNRDNTLTLRVAVRGAAMPKRLRYTLLLHSGTSPDENAPVQTVSLPAPTAPDAHTLEVTVPLDPASRSGIPECLWIAAETRYQATQNLPIRPVDRIGYRPFLLPAPNRTGYVSTNQKRGKDTETAR